MNKYHGKVVDIQDKNLIVLSETGAFHRIRKLGGEKIGQTLLYTDFEREEEPRKIDGPMPIVSRLIGVFKKKGAWALVPVMIFLMVFLAMPSNEPAYALVTMDINPSIGYYIDEDQVVVRTKAYNEDGQKVLAQMEDLKGQALTDAMNQTVQTAKDLSYLSEEKNEILITGALLTPQNDDGQEDQANEEAFKGVLDQVASQVDENASLDLTVYEVESTQENLEASENNGLSLGKTVLSEEFKVSEDAVKGKSISEMAKDISAIAKVKVYGQSKKDESEKVKDKDLNKDKDQDMDQASDQDQIGDQPQNQLEDKTQDKLEDKADKAEEKAEDKADKIQDKVDKAEDKANQKDDQWQDKTDKVKDKTNKTSDDSDTEADDSDDNSNDQSLSDDVDKGNDDQSDKKNNGSDKDKSDDKAKEASDSNGNSSNNRSNANNSNANSSNVDKNKDKDK